MRYLSTRDPDGQASWSFCHTLLTGLAPDGGLFLPEHYPQIDAATLEGWGELLDAEGYAALGAEVLGLFVDDIEAADLLRLCEQAWNGSVFATDQVVPVDQLPAVELDAGSTEGMWLAHLSDGPTAAFKDMAMQLLGQLFEFVLEREDQHLTILGATSGDTGSAAEHAMLGRDRIEVFMLTPAGRMSPFQQAQMFSIDDPSVHNIAVDGVFDDCQDLVKAVMGDAEFKARHNLGAVNSINWARLLAQVVYYVASYLRVTAASGRTIGDPVAFAVPTGNFGNICAGHIARQMGLPIGELVLATNENDVLHEFFATGVYRPRSAAETAATSSPSMDISKASNLERFIFDVTGRDGAAVRALYLDRLRTEGKFTLGDGPGWATPWGFVSGRSTHQDRVRTIRALWDSGSGRLVDPHTADAVHVAAGIEHGQMPMIVLETALPVKFADTIVEAIGDEPELPERFVQMMSAPRHVVELPNDSGALKAFIEDPR